MASTRTRLATLLIFMVFAVTTAALHCIERYIGDGLCDSNNNRASCDYDGGDCCPCTCIDSEDYTCGVAGFNCVDPEANCNSCIDEWIGDGWCDEPNNNGSCDYDGGDCCPCTCVDADFECGVVGFDCLEVDCDAAGLPSLLTPRALPALLSSPNASSPNSTPAPTPNPTPTPETPSTPNPALVPETPSSPDSTPTPIPNPTPVPETPSTPNPTPVSETPSIPDPTPAPIPNPTPVPETPSTPNPTPAPTLDSLPIGACNPNPCENGGTCAEDVGGGHICTCAPGFGGMSCQTNTEGLDPFFIQLAFEGEFTEERQAVFQSAATRWEQVVTHHPDCGSTAQHPAGRLLITSSLIPIDGVSGVLGQAGPTMVRGACLSISVEGIMEFDIADIESLEAQGTFEGVILHEMGHVLGVGTLWNPPFGSCTNCPPSGAWGCDATVAVYNDLLQNPGGSENDIVELDFGPGTSCGHFDEDIFLNELMTGFVDFDMRLSKLTAASLEDIEYVVDPSTVDPYTLPTFRLTAGISGNASSSDSSGAHTPFDDILTETEIVVIDENDEVVEVIPSQLVRFV